VKPAKAFTLTMVVLLVAVLGFLYFVTNGEVSIEENGTAQQSSVEASPLMEPLTE
jgi:hypothetical protein